MELNEINNNNIHKKLKNNNISGSQNAKSNQTCESEDSEANSKSSFTSDSYPSKNKSKNRNKKNTKQKNFDSSTIFLDYFNYLKPHPFFSEKLNSGDFTNDPYTIIHENKNFLDSQIISKNLNLQNSKNSNFKINEKTDLLPEEPEEILIFIVHGIGQNEEKLKTILNDRIKVMISLLYEKERIKFSSSLHFRMIDWKTPLFEREKENFNDLVNLNNQSKFPKTFIQNVPLDLMQYMSERNKYHIINDVVSQINSYFYLVRKHRKNFKGNVSVIGHSLGSVIMYEILSHMTVDEKYRNFGMNVFFNLSNEAFLEEIFSKEIRKDEKFKEVFLKEDFIFCSNLENKNKNNKKKDSSGNLIKEREKEIKLEEEGNKQIQFENEKKFSFNCAIEEDKSYLQENEINLNNNNLINKYNNEDLIGRNKNSEKNAEEEYISNILLKKRSERKSTIAKIKILDEEILNESFQNTKNQLHAEESNNKNNTKKTCFVFEHNFSNSNNNNENQSETIIKINNDVLINNLDPKKLDLKLNKTFKNNNNNHKNDQIQLSTLAYNSEKEKEILLTKPNNNNIKTEPNCEILDNSNDSFTAKAAKENQKNHSLSKLKKQKLEINNEEVEEETAEKSFEKLETNYNASKTNATADAIKQNLIGAFSKQRLNTNPVSENELSVGVNNYYNQKNVFTDYENENENESLNKIKNKNAASTGIKRRMTNAIALDEVTNTVGSLYSKITNVDLLTQEKYKNDNKIKANGRFDGNYKSNNNNNIDSNDKAYNQLHKRHLFDYRRRIYLKTQHKVFLDDSASRTILNKNTTTNNNSNKSSSKKNLINNIQNNSFTNNNQAKEEQLAPKTSKIKLMLLNQQELESKSKSESENELEKNSNEIQSENENEDFIISDPKTDYHRFFRVYSKHKKILPMIFSIEHFFTIGSPLSLFLTIERGRRPYLYEMETIKDFHNIIHPMDPVAYRIEHLIYDFDQAENSCLLPHFLTKGVKNVFLRKILNLVFCNSENDLENEFYNSRKKRYDYIVQESIPEKTVHVIGFLLSHMKYWNNPDVFYFILDIIHNK